jgi:hypothetical protein
MPGNESLQKKVKVTKSTTVPNSEKSSQISGTDSIYLHSLKIFERTQIRKKDPEYGFIKLLE